MRSVRIICVLVLVAAMPLFPARAQEEAPALRDVQLPNPMMPHTWFIIAAVGFFLAWCISYCLQLQKESLARKSGREDNLRKKEELLDRIADLEAQKETGSISLDRYEREFRKAKSQLSEILLRLARDHPRTPAER